MMTYLRRLFKGDNFLAFFTLTLTAVLIISFFVQIPLLLQKLIMLIINLNIFIILRRITKSNRGIFVRNLYLLFLTGIYIYQATQLNVSSSVIILYLFFFFILGVIWVSPTMPINFFIKNKKISLGNKVLVAITLITLISFELLNYFTWSLTYLPWLTPERCNNNQIVTSGFSFDKHLVYNPILACYNHSINRRQ